MIQCFIIVSQSSRQTLLLFCTLFRFKNKGSIILSCLLFPAHLSCRLPMLICFLAVGSLLQGTSIASDIDLPQMLYVWQRLWTDEVKSAVREASGSAEGLCVLCGEIAGRGEGWRFHRVNVDWASLAPVKGTLWLVFRIHTGALESEHWDASTFAGHVQKTLNDGADAGCVIAGIQIDYDCPTEKLTLYQNWLQVLRGKLAGIPVSITGLPDWLTSRRLPELLAGLDHFVLQVHSLELDRESGRQPVLFDETKMMRWVGQMNSLMLPFRVALPTYGWRIAYDRYGQPQRLEAEGIHEAVAGWTYQDVSADPAVLAGAVRKLAAVSGGNLKGFIWFRMPLPSDRMNWSLKTLRQVMKGDAPQAHFEAELRLSDNHLVELWLATHDAAGLGRLCVRLHLQSGSILASDLMRGFRQLKNTEERYITVSGPVYSDGEKHMAGWWLLSGDSDSEVPALSVEEIGLCP